MVDFTVRIASNIDQTPLVDGGFVETLDGDDREELLQSPVIDERLENAEIAEVLFAELFHQTADFLGGRATVGVEGGDALSQMPE